MSAIYKVAKDKDYSSGGLFVVLLGDAEGDLFLQVILYHFCMSSVTFCIHLICILTSPLHFECLWHTGHLCFLCEPQNVQTLVVKQLLV